MRHKHCLWLAAACLAVCLPLSVYAQGRGGGPPGGGGMGGPPGGGMGGPPGGGGMGGPPGGGRGGMGGPQFPAERGGMNVPGNAPQSRPSDVRPGLQLGPVDQRWWDERSYVKGLKLRPEQQAHMDAVFEQNRTALISRYAAVQQAQSRLNDLANVPEPDEAALFAQIDRVAQARADLEKATTHLILQLRREMDPDQIKKLESQR